MVSTWTPIWSKSESMVEMAWTPIWSKSESMVEMAEMVQYGGFPLQINSQELDKQRPEN